MSAANPPPKIACPHCQAQIKSPALPAGSQVNCPKCGKAFRLGQQGGSQGTGARAQAPGQRSQPASTQQQAPRPAPAASRPPRKLDNSVDPKVAPLNPGNVA